MCTPQSMSGCRPSHSAAAGNHGQGTITEVEVTSKESASAGSAAIVASHIPTSSAWRMTARSRGPKPSLRSSGLACPTSAEPPDASVIRLPCLTVDRLGPVEAQRLFEHLQFDPRVVPHLFDRPL